MKTFKVFLTVLAFALTFVLVSCGDDDDKRKIYNPETVEKVSVDRFSSAAGHLQVRTATNNLPAANAPVNFDEGVFITTGFGPNGQTVQYYNFDVQSVDPAPIWVLFREGDTNPVTGQLNIINVLPGENGYNDFWQVIKVTVPANYVANEVASYEDIQKRNYRTEPTTMIVNCPVVPAGSTASKRLNAESPALTRGWYKEKVVSYFNFGEKAITATSTGKVPTSPIYVTFNINPAADPATGPGSGFKTEAGNMQTHNVTSTVPSDASYSPLWSVNVYDNVDFAAVLNFMTANDATALGAGIAIVNCPIVKIN